MIVSLNGKIFTPSNSEGWKTWDEWKNIGYSVIKSSKATKHDGKNYFHKIQVTRTMDKYDRYLLHICD